MDLGLEEEVIKSILRLFSEIKTKAILKKKGEFIITVEILLGLQKTLCGTESNSGRIYLVLKVRRKDLGIWLDW